MNSCPTKKNTDHQTTDQAATPRLSLVTDQAAELGDQAAKDKAEVELPLPTWLYWGRFPAPSVTAPQAARLLTPLSITEALSRGLQLPMPISGPAEAADTLWLATYEGTELEAASLYEELSSCLSFALLEEMLLPSPGEIEIVELEEEILATEAHDEDPHDPTDPDPCPPSLPGAGAGALSRRDILSGGLALLGAGALLHLVAGEAEGRISEARTRSPQEPHQGHGGATLQGREAIPHGVAVEQLQEQEGGQEEPFEEEEDLEVTASILPTELPEPARAIWHVRGIGQGPRVEMLWPWIYGEVLHASSWGGRSGGWDLWLAEPGEPGRRYPERLRDLPGWIGSQRRMGARLEEGIEEMERDILLGRALAEQRRGAQGQAQESRHEDRLEGKGVER